MAIFHFHVEETVIQTTSPPNSPPKKCCLYCFYEVTYHVRLICFIFCVTTHLKINNGSPKHHPNFFQSGKTIWTEISHFCGSTALIFLPRVYRCINFICSKLVGGWFTNPFEKYAQVKLDHETPNRDENEKCLKPPPKKIGLPSIKLTASLPLKIPKAKVHLPTIHFQV